MKNANNAENTVNIAVIQFPSGRWGYAGWKIPGELIYTDTAERIAKMRAASCTHFLTRRAFETEQEANEVLAEWLANHPEYTNTGGVKKS